MHGISFLYFIVRMTAWCHQVHQLQNEFSVSCLSLCFSSTFSVRCCHTLSLHFSVSLCSLGVVSILTLLCWFNGSVDLFQKCLGGCIDACMHILLSFSKVFFSLTHSFRFRRSYVIFYAVTNVYISLCSK